MFKCQKKKSGFWDSTPVERNSFYREFGLVMKIMRNRRNISITDVAKRLRVREEIIQGYESGRPIPFIDMVTIYNYLGMWARP